MIVIVMLMGNSEVVMRVVFVLKEVLMIVIWLWFFCSSFS